eukprot:TRINITY_DN4772_c2_g3_i2.p1 TRINITY_DN4772_c2_g3~~TRINITY_DN4772_c2_g3_i2.p1  ORF type:complete len:340 (-),score=63.81 TRINITY_DN4772_c2_g3_i2:303-1322(-)
MMSTPLAGKPSFGLPFTDVLDEELPHDLKDDDLQMVNIGGSRDQATSHCLRIPTFVLPHTQASQGSSAINCKLGNDFGDSPRNLRLDGLDGSPSEVAFSGDAYASSNEVQGAHFTGKFTLATSVANESDETQVDGENGQHVARRGFAAFAAADALSGASTSAQKKKKKKGASASAEVMSQRGDHAENGARPDLTPASGPEAGKLPVVWPENATTVMLRNISNRYIAEEVLAEIIEEGFEGQLDFFYLPIDFKSKRNRGYAFINFHTPSIRRKFVDIFDDRRLTRYPTKKVLQVTPSAMQGFEAHVKAFLRKDSQRIVNPWFRPMIFGHNDVIGEIASGS